MTRAIAQPLRWKDADSIADRLLRHPSRLALFHFPFFTHHFSLSLITSYMKAAARLRSLEAIPSKYSSWVTILDRST